MRLLQQLGLNGLFACCLCGTPVRGADCICTGCDHDLPRIISACRRCGVPMTINATCGRCLRHSCPADSMISAFSYSYPIRQLIRQGKYNGEIRILNCLTSRLATRVQSVAQVKPELMIPVPLHRWRLINRGYNQALEICRLLKRRLDIPYATGLVTRQRPTRPMFDLNPAQRRANVRGSFRLHGSVNCRSVVIVDDVITTAATVDELAGLLRQAGVKHVQVWSLARAF